VFLAEGEEAALGTSDLMTEADYARLGFILADHARLTVNKRLMDPRTGVQNYRIAGR
jgi:hypothetical protein